MIFQSDKKKKKSDVVVINKIHNLKKKEKEKEKERNHVAVKFLFRKDTHNIILTLNKK